MGNTYGIPESSNEEWVVITIHRTCYSHFCGSIHIQPDGTADARLVASPHTASGGIVPQSEYDARMQEFNLKIAGAREQMMKITWFAVFFVVFIPQYLRSISDDLEVWMYIAASYIPMIVVAVALFRAYSTERRRVKEIFEPWKMQYGIGVEWYQGDKRRAPKLGFKLPASRNETQTLRYV